MYSNMHTPRTHARTHARTHTSTHQAVFCDGPGGAGLELRIAIGGHGWSNLTVGPHLAPFPLAAGEHVSLRVLLDRSVAEVTPPPTPHPLLTLTPS
jgi:hypothetical protein